MSEKNPFDDPNFGLDDKPRSPEQKNVFDDPDYGKAPGLMRSAGDTLVSAASSVLTGGELLSNAWGADSSVSKGFRDASQRARGFLSAGRRAEMDARAQKIKDAEDSGSAWEEIKANVGAFTEAPIDTTVEAFGTSVPTILATAMTRGRGRPVAGAAVGAAQGAGAVKGSIYEAVEQQYLEAGASPEYAAAKAAEAQQYSSDNAGQIALGAGLGAVAGSTGVEGAVGRMLSREAGEQAAKGVLRSALTGAAAEAPVEAAQGGQERLAANIALQNEGFDTPTWKGVAGAAALEGIAGGAAGGGFGAVEGFTARPPVNPAQDPLADPAGPSPAEPAVDAPAAGPVPADTPPDDQAAVGQGAPAPSGAPAALAIEPAPADPVAEVAPAPAADPAPTPSQSLGLDPAAGPLSAAAAVAVDTGTTEQLAQQATLQQAAEVAQQQAKGRIEQPQQGELIDQATGEILQPPAQDRIAQLQERLDYLSQQAKRTGWNKPMLADRERAKAELDSLLPPAAPEVKAKDAAKQALAQGGSELDAARAATDSLIEDMATTPDISISQAAPAAVEAAKRELAKPASVPEAIAQAREEKAQAGDIKAVIAKQIPDMTTAEIEQAIAHYGPDHKRTAKLNKELAKRTASPQTELTDGNQAPQAEQASPQRAQAPGATAEESAAAPANSTDAAGARWDAMTPAERQAVAEKAGVKPVFAKNLPNAGWERIGASVRMKLSSVMDSDLADSLEQSKAGAQELAARAAAHEQEMTAQRYEKSIRELASGFPGTYMGRPMAPLASDIADHAIKNNRRLTDGEIQELGRKHDIPVDVVEQLVGQPFAYDGIKGDAERGNPGAKALRAKKAAPADQATVSPETVTAPAAAEASNQSPIKEAETTDIAGSPASDADPIAREIEKAKQRYMRVRREGDQTKTLAAETRLRKMRTAAVQADDWIEAARAGDQSAIAKLEEAGFADTADALREQAAEKVQAEASRPADDGAAQWSALTPAGRRAAMKEAGVKLPDAVMWEHISDTNKQKLRPVVSNMLERATEPQAATEPLPAPVAAAAPDAETKAKDADRFANNKIFTADKVEAARARMRKKLGTLNSGIDPEMLIDGMTVAGAYIEAGVRNFTQYAKAMIEDMGDGVKPYLLSFWEGARNYPGLDTTGMTDAAESARQFEGLVSAADGKELAPEAVGVVADKPKARTKKTGARGDMVLTQDWGVEHINGYGDGTRETGNDTKDAFLKEARNYLNAVADALRAFGFEPHLDSKGKPEKPVSVNESGVAGSGDVSLVMRNEDNGNNVYITIGDTSLRGMVPSTPSGIAVMYRVGPGTDRYASKAGNTWAPVDLSANDLAALVNSRVRPVQKNEGTTNAGTLQTQELPRTDTGEAQADATAGNRNSEPLDDGLAGSRQGVDRGERVPAGTAGAGGSRAGGVQQSGQSALGTARDSGSVRTEQQPADAVADPATAETSPKPELDQPADFNLAGEDIGKGGLTKKYRDNIAAIRILKALESENRVATPEERRQIARYVGWGALKGVFDKDNKQWSKEYAELKELLTDAEYKAARASTLNAHYTSPTVVGGIFEALDQLGFTKGRVLEPSVGTGNFFGLMPAKMRKASQLHGVELDPLTSQIAAALYPSAKIAKATGFQDFQVPAEYFDLAIGNPPFGSEPLVDDDRSPYSGASIHNYFFAKSIDKLRPGGLLAMVVSHNFLDAKNDTTRRWIAERANLVSAVRLPRTAFKENAGTEVVTDILIFQKKTESERVNGLGDSSWANTAEIRLTNPKTGEESTHRISSYFEQNPSNVLGTPTAGGSMYRANEYTVEPLDRSLEDSLAGWVRGLPQGIYQAVERTHEPEAADVAVPDGIKVGSYFVAADGSVQIRGNDVMGNRTASAWTAPNAKAAERMKGMIGLRDALRAQMRLEKSPDATEDQIEAHRRELNAKYDAFQKSYGFLNDPTNRRIFLDDTESALLLALEFDYDKGVSKAVAEKEGIEARAPSAVKADIFKRRVMFPPADNIKVSNAKDALLASLNYKGRLDLDYMASLYDKPQADIVAELGDVVFNDPINGLVMSDEYLSGDVKTKLAEAEAAARDNPVYKRNVEALKKVIPADKRPSEIHAALGAPFIPAELFEQFAKEVTGATVKMAYIKATGQWIVDQRSEANATLNVGKWGISKMPATAILARTMAGQGVVVTETHRNPDGSTTTVVLERETEAAREKQAAMKAEWQRWLWADADRADMVAGIYNEKMNRIVPRQFDGSHMTFPGMSPAIQLLSHQKNAVWRGLQSRQVLLDHVVGAGKTFEVVTLFMEMRRLGIARKPFIAVPNHLTLQWRSEFSRLYPAANVLAATPDDFSKGNREKFFSKIITGDWDAVIVGHSSLKKIALPVETEKAVLEEQITEIASAIEDMKRARGDRNIIRDMEGIKARLEARMKQRLQALGERDKVVTFDELGVDAFAIDELHEFKNLFYNSTMERVPGMGNPAGSDKAFDLFVKLQWMFDTFGDKAPIIGATGTPVSNSLVEMFNMQRFLQYPMLKREGLHVFDAWAKQFGSVESLYEVSPSGTGYRQSSRFAKFKNLPALMAHYQTFADTVTLDDLKAQEEAKGNRFPVPKVAGGRPVNVVAKRSPQVASFMGVPELDVKNGAVQFGFNAARGDEAIIEQNSDRTAWTVQVRSTNEDGQPITTHLGSAKTEEDARLILMEAALSPKIKVDPESILGKFGRLRELNKETKGKVNALSLTGQANKAGLDYRLIDPSAPDFPGSKINLAVDRMMSIYRQWADDKGTQLVFCDLSVPLSSRAGFGSKERRIYVRDNGALTHKRGTMHTVAGHEDLPFFLVKEGGKDAKSFAIYDAATGLRVHSGLPAKAVAIEWAGQILADDAKRQRWIDARDALGDIAQDEIDDYNNANEIDTEETESITLSDIAGVSGATGFSVYDDIKAKLIAKGVPEREIAFIHDYGTPAAKDKLFKAVNNGSIRFLLGSTPKMGAGTNVQKRLVGLHHIDAPWRPSDLEQREGRIIRRGNELYERDPENFEVAIFRYATEQTYDTRRWQILEHKARGIEQLRKYDGTLNEIDDIEGEAANSADMKAAASGDPLILEETQLRNEVRRLESLQASHADESQSMLRRARDQARFANEWGPRDLAQFERLKKDADAHPVKKDEFAGLTIDGKQIDERDAAIEAIKKVMSRVLGADEPGGGTATFTYRGIDFTLTGNSSYAELESPTGKLDSFRMQSEAMPSAAGFLTRFANYINRIPGYIAELTAKIAEAKTAAEELREQSSKPFAQEAELAAAREAHKRVQRRLIAKGPDIPAAQRPLLEQAMEQQKEALREQGFDEALDEFLGSNQDRLRYSFAGRGALNADLLALSTAQRRIGAGEDAETVRQETGWHRGADGKWRFEISDHQADIAVTGRVAAEIIDMAHLSAIVDGRQQPTVGDVLNHPQLFAAYPDLAGIPISTTPADTTVKARLRRLATGPKVEVRGSTKRGELASVVLHELQHAIQIKEGFAIGGSKQGLSSDLAIDGAEVYRRLAGEVEARNTQARQQMTPRLRRDIAPEESADVAGEDVLVTFNGRDIEARQPANITGRPVLTEDSLVRGFSVEFPKLAGAVRKMLQRGKEGKRGGVVVINSADPLRIAYEFARKTGRSFDRTVQLFEDAGTINGFYDAKSGLTFLVGPNLNIVTGPAVLLHEMVHGQQRRRIDEHAARMLMERGKLKDQNLRAFLDRVAERMIDAGESSNVKEAAAYIVEQAVMEGRSQGYTLADNRFLNWVDHNIGKRVGDLIRSFLATVRQWMLRNGLGIQDITVDDLVQYAMVGIERAAEGQVSGSDVAYSRAQTKTEAFRKWFGDSKVVDAQGKPLVVYHATDADFSGFDFARLGEFTRENTDAQEAAVMAEAGVWTNTKPLAKQTAQRIDMPVYLSIQNPLEISFDDLWSMAAEYESGADLRAALEADGYDGISVDDTEFGGTSYVAFRPEQIKSAIGNNGEFDPSNPDIRFSRSGRGGGPLDLASSIGDSIKSITVTDVKRAAQAKFTDLLSLGLQALGRRQLIDLYDGKLLPMRKYERLAERMSAEVNDMGAQADELVRRWGKLKDGAALADLMHDATLAHIDADPQVKPDSDADPAAHEQLVARFNALSPDAQAVYREARDTYKSHHRNVIEAIKERIRRSEMSSERRAALLKQMDSEFYKAVRGVYFPLARFGSYVVAVSGPDGKIAVVQRAETMGEANSLRDQLIKKFPREQGYDVGKVTLDKEFVASRDSVGRGFMAELYGALGELELPASQRAELEDTLGQLYLASMPDVSWAKHGIHRKGTPGFSDDARRAFAQNIFHGARYLAKLRYGDRMLAELDRMQKYADARKQDSDYDQPKAQRVIDEMVKRHDAMMNPNSNPLSTALTSFGFVYYLGLSPAAAAVNLSQTALVAYPVMGAKWGYRKAAAALMKASNEAVRGKNDITGSLSDEEKRAYEKAVKDGAIDVTQAHDLAGIAQGEDAGVLWKIRPVMRAASFLFHQAEVFNRQVTFIAAFRLAREAGASPTAAYEQAKKATYDGHFDYSSANRPRLMQGNVAKVVLLFKQYAQNMIYTMARNAYLSVAGEKPEVRKEARKVFAGIMGLHAMAAGVLGLPLVQPILAIASALGGDDDEPWDAEVAMRNMLADAFGVKAAEVIARGVSRLGPADISGRVSLNNLLLPDVQEGLEGRRLAEAWTTAMLGPIGGLATNVAVGMNHIAEGRYSMGLESILPVSVRNPIKAYRLWDEGAVDKSGVVIKDEIGAAGIASQVIGFSPSELRLAFEGKQAIYQADRRLGERRSELMSQFARAALEGDQQGMAEARAEIAEFNRKNPTRRIQANHLMQSVRARRQRIARAKDGIYLPANRSDARAAGRFANQDDL